MSDEDAGPRPNPSAAARTFRGQQPTVTVVPALNAVLGDIRSLLKQGLDVLKQRAGALTPNDVRTLEGLARTAEITQRMDKVVREQIAADLAKLDDDELEAAAQDPVKLLMGGDQ